MAADSERAKAKRDFGEGKMSGHVMAQAIPLALASLVQLLYNVVDRIYIGHIPNAASHALTGIGLVFPIISLVLAFTQLYSMGGAPLTSIEWGRQRLDKAEKIIGNTFLMLFLTGGVLMAVLFGVKEQLLYLFGASAQTFPYANAYLSIYLIGTLFVLLGTGMNAFINAQGFPKIGMSTIIIGAVLNLILDPVFIFGLGLGVRGAAIATVISQAVSCIWVLRFMTGRRAIMRLRLSCMKPDFRLIRRIMGLGFSGFLMAATNAAVQIVCNATLGMYGGDVYIGIMTILNSVRELAQLPVSSLGNGGQPVLGYNFGARKPERIRQGISFMFWSGFLISLAIWAVIMLFPSVFLRVFTEDAAILEAGPHCMRLYFLTFFTMSFQFSGQSTFVALGDSRHAVCFTLLRKVVMVIPLTLILPKLVTPAVSGVFAAEPISNVIGGLASFLTMIHVVWFGTLKKMAKENEARKPV